MEITFLPQTIFKFQTVDVNCNISKITKDIFDNKKLGLKPSDDDITTFVETYLNSIGCGIDPCIKIVTPCTRIFAPDCSTFALPSFSFTQQSYGTNVDFIVNPNDLNGLEPYTYSWTFDPQYFEIRVIGSDSQSTIMLTKLQEDKLNFNYLTEVTVAITDNQGCSFTKSCEFRYTKTNGVSNPTLNCNEETFPPCEAPDGASTINITNSSFKVLWTELAFQYELIVKLGDVIIYSNQNAHSGITISGLVPNTEYTVQIINHCGIGTSPITSLSPITSNIPSADINCSGAYFTPDPMAVGVPYTGSLVVPYTSGNGISYTPLDQTISGLLFHLPASILAIGSGNLIYSISGIPTGDISIPISLFGSSCTVNKTVTPICATITSVSAVIGNYDAVSNTYPVTVSWPASPGALYYIFFDGTNTSQTTNTSVVLSYPPNTMFSGTVTSFCQEGSLGTPVPYTSSTPTPPCTLLSETSGNITSDGFSVISINPSLVGSETLYYELHNTTGGGDVIVTSGYTSTLPYTFTGLTPGTYHIVLKKYCTNIDTFSVAVGGNITIPTPPPTPTVYVKFNYVNSTTVPLDTYTGACDTRGSHYDTQSKPAIINVTTYSDSLGTIPLNVTGMGIVLNFQITERFGTFVCPYPGVATLTSSTITPHTLPLSSTSTSYVETGNSFVDMYQGAIDCGGGSCIHATWYQRLVQLLAGTGYTLI